MKRMICVMLALIMLLGMMPVSASAADKSISEAGITVLKQLQNYLGDECVQCGNEYRIGYGTICTETTGTHGVTDGHPTYNESKADKALRTKLAELDAAVNSFAAKNNLNLKQHQFDALVVFSYDMGTAWLNGNGVLKTAILNGTTGNAFLNAIGQSADYGGDPTDKVTGYQRRMIEGNMYLNGAYSNVAPSAYGWVKYKINRSQENMAEANANGEYVQYFDSYNMSVPQPVPTRAGYTFLGWYTTMSSKGDTWVHRLYMNQAEGQTLFPKWQKYGTTWKNAVTGIYTKFPMASAASNIIVSNPTSTTSIGYVTTDHADINSDFIDANGARWGRLADGRGWILITATVPTTNTQGTVDVNVTVTNDFVRKRANASATSKDLGRYNRGDKLRIINTATHGGLLWGQVADASGNPQCWVALMYTNWNEAKDKIENNNAANKPIGSAVVSCNGYLNVRNEAGTDYAIVGALANGDLVDIYEIKFVNGHKWGRTSAGWIQLTYCKVTMLTTDIDYTTSADVLAYTFTGKTKEALYAHVDTVHNSDTVGKQIAKGTVVAMSMIKNDAENNVWGFNGTGWIQLSKVTMDVAKYIVVSENAVSVREQPNSGSTAVDKVTKGVELDISDVKVVDATIWGFTAKYNGWVNLASKYVSRTNAPIIENVSSNTGAYTGLIATIINTDTVNVRRTSSAKSKKIGEMHRGQTAKVWEGSDDLGWYKIDSNGNGVYDYEADGWVSLSYLGIDYATIDTGSTGTGTGTNGTTGGTAAAVETGMGIVANTYAGVNIRQGAGTGYASVGKYLNGTSVEILEVTKTATSKWGRTNKGWVCMDYITMLSKYPVGGAGATPTEPVSPNPGGSTTDTKGDVTISSTPANYSGRAAQTVNILKTYDVDALNPGAQIQSTLNAGQSINIYELVAVTQKVTYNAGDLVDGVVVNIDGTILERTTYWARVDGGWIQDPDVNLSLNVLDETTYTVTTATNLCDEYGAVKSNNPLDKNTQVVITQLKIMGNKVWGYVEASNGWVRLDNLKQGAYTITEPTQPPVTSPVNPVENMGNGSNTGGYVTNTAGYRYTGKVINCNEVNVRAGASTAYGVTTQLKNGASLVIYETVINENMAWGRCDAGWVYLYYVDLTPVTGAVDARVVYNDNTVIYSDMAATTPVGTYARMAVIDILEIVGTMARTDKGWVRTTDLL